MSACSSVQKVSRERAQSVKKVSWTLQGHSHDTFCFGHCSESGQGGGKLRGGENIPYLRADFWAGDPTKHFSVKKKGFSVKRGEGFSERGGLVRISTGKAIQ